MKKSDVYEIAIKILGVYLIYISITFVQAIVFYSLLVRQEINNYADVNAFRSLSLLFGSSINLIVVIAFCFLLLFKTKSIVKIICKPSDFQETSVLFADKKTIYEISLTLTGMIIIVWTFPQLANELYLLNESGDLSFSYKSLRFVLPGLKIAFAIVAIIYSSRISAFLGKYKNGDS